jgi:hypothetical protein
VRNVGAPQGFPPIEKKQPVAKVVANREQRGPIVASDQGSYRGHQCSEISLTEDPSPWSASGPPGVQTAAPLGGKQMVDPLDQWDIAPQSHVSNNLYKARKMLQEIITQIVDINDKK